MKRFWSIAVLCMLSLSVYADEFRQSRERYLDAREALQAGNKQAFTTITTQLTDYPLYPYLVYEELSSRLKTASNREILDFTERFSDTPLPYRLRSAWLNILAERKDWNSYLQIYDERSDAKSRCNYLHARLTTGRQSGIEAHAERLWLSGTSQPEACDPVFSWLKSTGRLENTLIWKRIELAMAQGNLNLARYLAKSLNQRDQNWVNLWTAAHSNPEKILQDRKLEGDGLETRKIILHAINRLIDKDVELAKTQWNQLKTRYAFSNEQRLKVDRDIVLRAALRRHPKTDQWLAGLPEEAFDQTLRIWRLKTALRNANWKLLKEGIP